MTEQTPTTDWAAVAGLDPSSLTIEVLEVRARTIAKIGAYARGEHNRIGSVQRLIDTAYEGDEFAGLYNSLGEAAEALAAVASHVDYHVDLITAQIRDLAKEKP